MQCLVVTDQDLSMSCNPSGVALFVLHVAWCCAGISHRVLGGLSVLQCLQPVLLEAAEPLLLRALVEGRIDAQVWTP